MLTVPLAEEELPAGWTFCAPSWLRGGLFLDDPILVVAGNDAFDFGRVDVGST
jgi:hypothetical protein